MALRWTVLACSVILLASCKGSVTDEGGDGDGDGDGRDRSGGDGDAGPGSGGAQVVGSGGSGAGGSAAGGSAIGTGGAPIAAGGSLPMGGADPAMGGADIGMGGAGTGGAFVAPADAVPSAGCSLPALDPEDMTSSSGPVYVSTPDGYDGSEPFPLILGFPAFGNRLTNILSAAEQPADTEGVLRRNYVVVRALPSTSDESTWEGDDVDVFDEVYRMVEENVCFDKSRVFGVGNEGGARYLTKHVCEPAPGLVTPNVFRALAIIGHQSLPCDPWPDMPLLFMSSNETEWSFGDNDGRIALEGFKAAQGCADNVFDAGTWPTGGDSSFDYVCEDIQGCSSDLRFCNWMQPIDDLDMWLASHNEHVHRFFADYL